MCDVFTLVICLAWKQASRRLFSVQALAVVPKEGWAQILAFAGFLELVVNKKSSEPGFTLLGELECLLILRYL